MKKVTVLLMVLALLVSVSFCKKKSEEEKLKERTAKAVEETQKGLEEIGKAFEKMAEGGQKEKVSVIDYSVLQAALPEISGWKKSDVSAGTTSFGNLSTSQARATYTKGEATVNVSITDVAGVKLFFAPIFALKNMKFERKTDTGYERSIAGENFFGKESYDKTTRSGELVIVYKNRFVIELDGTEIDSTDVLKEFLKKIDLSKFK